MRSGQKIQLGVSTLIGLLKKLGGITNEKLAEYMGCSSSTINRYSKNGEFPTQSEYFKCGNIIDTFKTILGITDNNIEEVPIQEFVDEICSILSFDFGLHSLSEELAQYFARENESYERSNRDNHREHPFILLIEKLYIRCAQKYVVADAIITENDFEEAAKSCFANTLETIRFLSCTERNATLQINEEWLPTIRTHGQKFNNLVEYMVGRCNTGDLRHGVIFAEPGVGKTYSIVATINELFVKKVNYEGKRVIPVFVSPSIIEITEVSVVDYLAETLCGGDRNAIIKLFRGDEKTHLLVFIDAINESKHSNDWLEEIKKLSHIMYKNLTLIVSSNSTEEKNKLQGSKFNEIRLNMLDVKIVDKFTNHEVHSEDLKRLLCKPFYLAQYLLIGGKQEIRDEYSLIEAYVNNCKEDGRIVAGTDNAGKREWLQLLEVSLPKLCYKCVTEKRMYFECDEVNDVSGSEDNVARLDQSGMAKILSKEANPLIYFEHENYRNFFAAKYLRRKILELCDNPHAPQELKTLLLEKNLNQIESTPINVLNLLSPRLYNEKALNRFINEFAYMNNLRELNNLMTKFYQIVIYLFSFSTRTLEGLNLIGANLWMADFTKFDRIINCNLMGAKLNPETLWIHHAKISYGNSNSGRMKAGLIFLSGAEGFEVYNQSDDRQLFIKFPRKEIPRLWGTESEALLFSFSDCCYRIDFEEIRKRLHSNKETVADDLVVSDAYLIKETIEKSVLDPAVTCNERGEKLRFAIGEELYIEGPRMSVEKKLVNNCKYATFIENDIIFVDCDGVYIVINQEGMLLWKRMIKPIVPQVAVEGENFAVINMLLPGNASAKQFKYVFSEGKALFLDCKLKERDLSAPLKKRGTVCSENLWSDNIIIKDKEKKEYQIFGGAIEFTNTVFNEETKIAWRSIDDKEKLILKQFGGIME